MARRSSGVSFSRLRGLIDSSLCEHPEFARDLPIAGRIRHCGAGLFHDNYVFEVGKRMLVLRLAKHGRAIRTKEEAVVSLEREAQTLQSVEQSSFPYPAPHLVSLVADESGATAGLIESCVEGAPLSMLPSFIEQERTLAAIADAAAAVHRLPPEKFGHLSPSADSQAHVRELLEQLLHDIIAGHPAAAAAIEWIECHLPAGRPAVVLHGDLLPQNIFHDPFVDHDATISVIDWESARIGDPAYDLAIVTRGKRRPLRIPQALQKLVALYNDAAGTSLQVAAVRVHELLLHLAWLCEAAQQEKAGCLEGHGPQLYEDQIHAVLRQL